MYNKDVALVEFGKKKKRKVPHRKDLFSLTILQHIQDEHDHIDQGRHRLQHLFKRLEREMTNSAVRTKTGLPSIH